MSLFHILVSTKKGNVLQITISFMSWNMLCKQIFKNQNFSVSNAWNCHFLNSYIKFVNYSQINLQSQGQSYSNVNHVNHVKKHF